MKLSVCFRNDRWVRRLHIRNEVSLDRLRRLGRNSIEKHRIGKEEADKNKTNTSKSISKLPKVVLVTT